MQAKPYSIVQNEICNKKGQVVPAKVRYVDPDHVAFVLAHFCSEHNKSYAYSLLTREPYRGAILSYYEEFQHVEKSILIPAIKQLSADDLIKLIGLHCHFRGKGWRDKSDLDCKFAIRRVHTIHTNDPSISSNPLIKKALHDVGITQKLSIFNTLDSVVGLEVLLTLGAAACTCIATGTIVGPGLAVLGGGLAIAFLYIGISRVVEQAIIDGKIFKDPASQVATV